MRPAPGARAALPALLLAATALGAGLLLPGTAAADHVAVNDTTFPWGACARVCIPAVVQPRFVDPDERPADVWLAPEAQVVGVALLGEARAYPMEILVWHEIVNDVVAGEPVAVTYCPLCGSSVTYGREVGGQVLTLQTSGRLHRNDLVMQDDETGSLWPQLLGEAVSGPLHGARLDTLTSTLTSWGEWKRAHPGTLLLARPLCSDFPYDIQGCPTKDAKVFARSYGEDPYEGYAEERRVGITSRTLDDIQGLHPKTQVVGAVLDGVPKAWVTSRVAELGVVNDDIEGAPVVVTFDGAGVRVFRRDAGRAFAPHNATHMTDQDGAAWSLATGRNEEAPAGRLAQVPTTTSFWFAWVDFHPDTRLHGVANVVGTKPPAGARLQGMEPVTLRFSDPVDRASVEANFTLEPAHEVTLGWEDARTLVMTPVAPWPRGPEVVVRLDGGHAEDGLPLAAARVAFPTTAQGGFAAGFEHPGIALGPGILFGAAAALALVRRMRRRRGSGP